MTKEEALQNFLLDIECLDELLPSRVRPPSRHFPVHQNV